MALKYNKATFLVVSLAMIAALLESSTAQSTVHVVGGTGASAWVVPTGGATVYSNWAANNTFKVNDVLVFNFVTRVHDVAQVTKAAFGACNTTSPISRKTNSPANFTLTSAGEHYYICTSPGHCLGGQKLALNVTSGASSPAPTPTPTPTPAAPAPTPTSSPPPPTPTQTPAPTPTTSSPSPPAPTPTSPPSTTATPPSSPSPNGGNATPPSGNSAKSLGVALSSTFLAIFVALLY
ncbi:hypothetical protein QYF36_016981 [Acer negundo]|nr:hypothetical protein QYF36_016981 [Acer negundo]